MKKIYCKNCKFYNRYFGDYDICSNPQNIRYKDTYFERLEYIPEPRKINKKNNCKHFEEMLDEQTEQI